MREITRLARFSQLVNVKHSFTHVYTVKNTVYKLISHRIFFFFSFTKMIHWCESLLVVRRFIIKSYYNPGDISRRYTATLASNKGPNIATHDIRYTIPFKSNFLDQKMEN